MRESPLSAHTKQLSERPEKLEGLDHKLAEPYRHNDTYDYDVPKALIAIWLTCGPSFQLEFDLDDDDGLDSLIYWWFRIGRADFPGLRATVDRTLIESLHLVPLADHADRPGNATLTPFLQLLLRHRPDLTEIYDTQIQSGVDSVWYWWLVHGQEEYLSSPEWLVRRQLELMHSSTASARDLKNGVPTTLLLRVIWGQDPRLSASVSLDTSEGRAAMWDLFLQQKVKLLRLPTGIPALRLAEDDGLFISAPVLLTYARRPDLQAAFDLETPDGREALLHWWLQNGVAVDPANARNANVDIVRELHEDVLTQVPDRGAVVVTPLLAVIWRQRADLRSTFNLETSEGRDGLMYWWLNEGQGLYSDVSSLVTQALVRQLHEEHLGEAQQQPHGYAITPLMALIWRQRGDLRAALDLNTPEGRDGLLYWWLSDGQGLHPDVSLLATRNLVRQLHDTPLIEATGGQSVAITPLLALLWRRRPDLHSVFDLERQEGRDGLVHWWLSEGQGLRPEVSTLVTQALIRQLHDEPLGDVRVGEGLLVTPLLALLWRQRSDLNSALDLGTSEGRDGLVYWWLSEGQKLYPALAPAARRLVEVYHVADLARMAEVDRIEPTRLLGVLCRSRPDLRSLDLVERDGVDRLWWWWLASGQDHYLDSPAWLVDEQVRWLHRCDGREFARTWSLPETLLMRLVRRVVTGGAGDTDSNPELAWPLLASRADALGLPAYGQPYFEANVADGDWPESVGSLGRAFPNFLAFAYVTRADLRATFPSRPASVIPLMSWFLRTGIADYPALLSRVGANVEATLRKPMSPEYEGFLPTEAAWLFELSRANRDADVDGHTHAAVWWASLGKKKYGFSFAQDDSPGEAAPSCPAAARPIPARGSVALFGYPHGEFGLGEDIRLLRSSLELAGIRATVVRAPWQIIARQRAEESSVAADLAEFNPETMFYVMPAFDTTTLLTKMGPEAFVARRRIGFWQWELEHFPEPAKLAFDLVDEIWCHSEHSAAAFRAATDKPVIKVPLPVTVPDVEAADRADFGLPKEGFVVFTSFDGASSISRKNPLGSIRAFQLAFPRETSPDARLMVKAMNTINDALWRECKRIAQLDRRIVIIDDVLDRTRYYELLKACDAVISLHRAEGFGRLMAEAMALGIPVIATAYSGNLDFMTEENSWLVGGQMVDVLPGDYPFHQGQHWMDPDVQEAAEALRECARDVHLRQTKMTEALESVDFYNPLKCGLVFQRLLLDSGRIISDR